MFKLPILSDFFVRGDRGTVRHPQPFSPTTQGKQSRLKGAIKTESVCPYCAVGCATNIYTKDGQVIDIEGNPESPINEGTLCPKGANTFQLHHNPHRIKHVMWRAPYAEEWQRVPLDWADGPDRQADQADAGRGVSGVRTRRGSTSTHVANMGTLGGATLDNEENYLIKKLFGVGLGVVSASRTKPGYDTPHRCPVWVPAFGRGAATNYQQDLANSDCILFMGSNMAEAHPVGFRWPMKAREKGAHLIHVDPHFSRTSAMCQTYVGVRAGSDIAFLGGIVNYILSNDRWFKEFVHGVHERQHDHRGRVRGPRGAGGHLQRVQARGAGLPRRHGPVGVRGVDRGRPSPGRRPRRPAAARPGTRRRRPGGAGGRSVPGEESGQGQHGYGLMGGASTHASKKGDSTAPADGGQHPQKDPTLQHPRCVFQLLKKHYARYTPEMVADICGCSPRS